MEPARIKGIKVIALVMCTAHLLRPIYFKIMDPPLCKRVFIQKDGMTMQRKNLLALSAFRRKTNHIGLPSPLE